MDFVGELFGPSLLRALVGRTVVVAMLALALLGGVAIVESNQLIVGQFREQAALVSRAATAQIGNQADHMTQDAVLFASLPTVKRELELRDRAALTSFLADTKAILSLDYLAVAGTDGRLIASVHDFATGAALAPELAALAGTDPASAWILSDEPAGIVIRAVAPIRAADQTMEGIIEVGTILGDGYVRGVKGSSDAELALIWSDKVRVSTISIDDLGSFPSLAEVDATPNHQLARTLTVGGRTYEAIFTVQRSPKQAPGLIAVLVPTDGLIAAQRTLVGVVLLLALALSAIVMVFALRTARTMTRPLAELAGAAQRIEAGDYSVRVPERSRHEIGTLERAFDTMARSLDERQRAQREYVDEVRTVNEVADAVVGVTDRERIFAESLRRLVALFKADGAAIVVRADAPGAPAGSGGRLVAPSTIAMDADAVSSIAARILVKEMLDPNAIHELQMPNADLPHLVAIPLTARGRAVGLLTVAFAEPHQVSESEARGLRTIARLVSVAKENAELVNELRDNNLQLERANRLKSEFLASVSHELRTPMNAIIGYTKLMLDGLDGELTEQQEADVSRVAQAADNLLGLINGILDLAKIEAGKMELANEAVDVREVVSDVLELMTPNADAKGLRLAMEVPDGTPPAWADRARVRQVLVNLVGNAVKFTETGGVTVSVTSAEGWLTVAVADTGVGMPEDALSYVFDEFRQADSSTTRRYGGTGLGLAISKRLVALHGGRIWADSVAGKGSTFSFTLPVRVRPTSDQTGLTAVSS